MTGNDEPVVSRRGVYYDLSKSPYGFETPYGDLFKFSSAKKLEMYTRDIDKELERVNRFLDRNGLRSELPPGYADALFHGAYRSLYRKIEG